MSNPEYLLFCDVETGGIDPAFSDVIEIAGKLLDRNGNQHGPVFFRNMHPIKPVHPDAAKVNGYSKEKWLSIGAKSQAEAWADFNAWLTGKDIQLVNWNPSFDMGFIRPHCDGTWKLSYHPLDILSMVWPYVKSMPAYPDEFGKVRRYCDLKGAVRRCLGREMNNAHSANGDVDACVDLYKWIISKGW